jgi:hypothetical protein
MSDEWYQKTNKTEYTNNPVQPAEHGGCVIATVAKLPRTMWKSQFDPQERIPYG